MESTTGRHINREKLVKISDIFHGLAYPVRLQILELIEDGKDYGVSEIRENIKIEASLLSHHLSKMKSVGILESYRKGRNIFYRLALPEITKVLDCIYECELKI